MIIDIIERIDCNEAFSSKEIKTFTTFLEEIKKEHCELNIQNTLNYMINFIKCNEK